MFSLQFYGKWVHFLFDALPVALAILVSITSARVFYEIKDKTKKLIALSFFFSSLILIFAQTSWWVTYVFEGKLEGTQFSNYLWATFNSLVMSIFLCLNREFRNEAQ